MPTKMLRIGSFGPFYYDDSFDDDYQVLRVVDGASVGDLSEGNLGGLKTLSKTVNATQAPGTTDSTYFVDTTTGDVDINLASAATISGREYQIKKIDSSANKVVITPDGAETIEGAATLELKFEQESVTIKSDGTNWRIVGRTSGVILIGSLVSPGTSGSILFVDSSGELAQDNSNLFWDDTNNLLKTRLHLLAGTAAAGTAPLKLTSGTKLTTPEDGVLEYDGTSFFLTSGDVRRSITLGNDTRITDLTVVNTTTETTIHTSAIIADELKAYKMYKIILLGKVSTASASDYFTLRVKMGGSTLITVVMTAKNITNEHFHATTYVTIRTIGASGTYAAHIEGSIGAEAISVTPVTGSVDTTVSEDITMTLQWAGADIGNSFTLMQSVLDVIN